MVVVEMRQNQNHFLELCGGGRCGAVLTSKTARSNQIKGRFHPALPT